jgi:hypothetical protein
MIIETEVNGDSTSTNERGPPLGLSCRYKRFLPCLCCSRLPSTNIFFLYYLYTLFQFIYPIAQQAGHAVVLGRLSLSICLGAGTQIDDSKKRVGFLRYYVPSKCRKAKIINILKEEGGGVGRGRRRGRGGGSIC